LRISESCRCFRQPGRDAALPYARKLAEALPGDPGAKKLVAELELAR